MAISLQEQLLKAGVASKKQVNKAKADKRKSKKTKQPVVADDNVQQQLIEKREKDRQLNLEREQQKALKEKTLKARQIIDSNVVSIPKNADVAHQFPHLKFVKSIYVDKQLQSQLICGQLTIAFVDDKYLLIPTVQAHRVAELQPNWIVELPKKETIAEDDPYAAYEIPDDLMW